MAFQPLQVGDTLGAEAPQRVVADHALGFVAEVVEHRLGGVREARRLLLPRAATGIHHAPTAGAGTTAIEAVGNQHIGTLGAGLQRRASPGGAPADHQHIALPVPVQRCRVIHLQGFENRRDRGVHGTSRRCAARWLAAT
ncbi:hypothetical protein D3C79_746630 [compost metagenome]